MGKVVLMAAVVGLLSGCVQIQPNPFVTDLREDKVQIIDSCSPMQDYCSTNPLFCPGEDSKGSVQWREEQTRKADALASKECGRHGRLAEFVSSGLLTSSRGCREWRALYACVDKKR